MRLNTKEIQKSIPKVNLRWHVTVSYRNFAPFFFYSPFLISQLIYRYGMELKMQYSRNKEKKSNF